ncbi:MAG: DUF262 domain-containing protein [Chloroflexota bacterium]|nr:DUF262 domain-containing protein [Chloroflexota bacterium]MDE2910731.1 DUF262 domain-containing protein [Chloroflexota bacterium]
MKIQQLDLTVRDLVAGYRDDGAGGVVGYGGALDIRPPYQREFVYGDKERKAVIDSILRGYPLNVMYWSDRGDGRFEIIDGQQRTISIAQYVAGDFSIPFDGTAQYFLNLPRDIRSRILDYEPLVYACSGTDSERLAWFKIINIAGVRLTDQELRNANFAGPWVTDAKRFFSRSGCAAYGKGKDYVKGSPIRQEFLETAIKWISGDKIEDYMGRRKNQKSAEDLWKRFESVIDWVESTFPNEINLPMKGVDWGELYSEFKDKPQDAEAIAQEAEILDDDDDVTKKLGIYPYILTRDESKLSIRAFSKAMKRKVYRKQDGICAICKAEFNISEMEADHIRPWRKGGKTVEENCQMLCRKCNREKSAK